MRLNKIFYPAILLLAVAFACNPLEDSFDEIADETAPDYSLQYTFTEDDYAAVAELQYALATPEDSIIGDFVESELIISSDVTVLSSYMEDLAETTYPQWGLGTSVIISYNYTESVAPVVVAEDFSAYADAPVYELDSADYEFVGLAKPSYFFPAEPAEDYLDIILANGVQDALDGDIYAVTYLESSEDTLYDYSSSGTQVVYTESFDEDLSGVSTFNISGDAEWYQSTYNSDGRANISGYNNSTNQVNEDWLVTSSINLAEVTESSMSFTQAAYITLDDDITDVVSVLVSTDFDGSDVTTATWTDVSSKVDEWLTDPGYSGYTDNLTSTIDLSDFDGEQIYVAFRFNITAALIADGYSITWQIYDIEASGQGSGPELLSAEPSEYTKYYEFDGSDWSEMENVYVISGDDYDDMGFYYDNFSSSAAPEDYIPTLLSIMYPYAQEGDEYIIVYQYYSGSTYTEADNYIFSDGTWVTELEEEELVVEVKTGQVVYNSDGWTFDPSVTFTMESSDYQLIVDEVAKVYPDLIDSYGTAEYYYGAGAYYENFDLGYESRWDGDYAQDEYVDLTAEERTALMVQRMGEGIEVLLEVKYPNAALVDGFDVMYTVYSESYDGTYGDWVTVFQLVGTGEFELSEGPTEIVE